MRPLDPRLLPHMAPARVPLAGMVAASVVAGGLVIAQAFAVAALVTGLLHASSEGDWASARNAGTALAVVTLARALVTWLVDASSARASDLVTSSLRRRILEASFALGPFALSRRRSGELALLATRGAASVDPYITRYLPALFLGVTLPALTVLALATQDLLSAAVVVCTLPLVPVFAVLVGLATRDRAGRQWQALSLLSGHFVDIMRGLPTLVVYRRASAQSASIRAITDRYRRATSDTLKLAFASSAVLELVATLSVALVAVIVGLRLSAGSLDLRTALVVLLLAPEAYWPLRRLGAEFHGAAEGTATFEAVDELLASVPASATRTPQAPVGPGIDIQGVTLSYPGAPVPVLRDLSDHVPTRGLTAVTGPSGAGKSTLLAALMGHLRLSSGAVTVAGTDVLTGDLEAWQSLIAWVPQRPWIAAASVRDNVRLARPTATDAEVWAALERVGLADHVATLPRGLDEEIGEDGDRLSAGERARLALARVVIAERPWVLLDEPTAHLDPQTEQVVAETLVWLAQRSAVVVVAHRQRLVDLADHVIALPAVPVGAAVSAVPVGTVGAALVAAPVTGTSAESQVGGERQTRWGLAGGAALGALAAASGVALTATAGWLIARAAEHPPVLVLMVAIVGVRAFGLARPTLRYAERLVSHDVALRLLAERRAWVYDALVPLTPGRLGPHRGDVLASIVDDVDAIVDKYLRVRAPLVTFALVSALAVAFAGWVLPAAGLVTLAVLTVAGGLAYAASRLGVGRAEQSFISSRGRLATLVVQRLQGAPDLIMWQATEQALDEVDAASHAVGRAASRSLRAVSGGRALAILTCGLGMLAMAAVGASALEAGDVSRPMLALLILLPLALLEVVTPLADAGALQVRTSAADARLTALARTEPLVTDPANPLPLDTSDASVTLDHVSAGWGEEAAFRDVTLDLRPGARLGVVGPSGSGKSTLAAVLLRFLDPSAGTVRVGTTDMRDLLLDDVRRTVGLVDDDPHVFASTLRENIRLARPGCTDDHVVKALRRAQLGAWLDSLPRGLDTMLGDGYAHVSGGERARLGLARAVLADQSVLVLDEPTAQLDPATARAVADDLLQAADDRTVVWITHGRAGLDRMHRLLDLTPSGSGGYPRTGSLDGPEPPISGATTVTPGSPASAK